MVRHTIVIYAEYNLDSGIGQDSLEDPACRFLALV
jgi:hypothetical protein